MSAMAPAGGSCVTCQGATFEIPLDTLILAISQHAVLDLFGAKPPDLTDAGYIAVDPFTLESSIPGVYAIGDVAADGPSSIVKAAADGKAAAAAIIAAHGVPVAEPEPEAEPVDVAAMVVRRARREYRVPVKTLALEERDGSVRPCWATRPRRPWPRRAVASTAIASAACASACVRTWRS